MLAVKSRNGNKGFSNTSETGIWVSRPVTSAKGLNKISLQIYKKNYIKKGGGLFEVAHL